MLGLGEFALALLAFFAAHSLPRATGLRDVALAQIGRRSYVVGYSLLSIGLLIWLISAALRAPYIALWAPNPALVHIALTLMLPACLLLAMAATRPNPLSIAFARGDADRAAPGVLAVIRHPILWAFTLWSAAHLLVNGDVVAVILFGGMAGFGIAGMTLMDHRARREMGLQPWMSTVAALRRLGPKVLLTRRCMIEAAVGRPALFRPAPSPRPGDRR